MSLSLLGTASRYFLAVARTGSVSQAAAQLHVAVSAVSRQIGKLEDGLGCALFERQARGMRLTPAGERLSSHLRAAAQDTERVLDEVQALGGQHMRRVRVTCSEGLASGFMAGVMAGFRASHPDCSLHLLVGPPGDVSRHLLRGDADVGVKFAVASEKGLNVLHWQPAPIMALMAPDHALAGRAGIDTAELASQALALPDSGTTVRQMLDLACAAQGLRYRVACSGNYATLLALTQRGGLITLSARVSAAHAIGRGELVAVPLTDGLFSQRSVQVLAAQGVALSPVAQALGEALVAAISLG
jgi:DNA-binding transcriptional LysR family regulator